MARKTRDMSSHGSRTGRGAVHDPGQVLLDAAVAVAVADGAEPISGTP